MIQQASELIFKDFNIEHVSESFYKNDNEAYKELKKLLAQRIDELINGDLQQLKNILYRIDVDESNAMIALSEKPPEQASSVLAELIIERQLQKVITRMKHKNEK